MTELEPFIVECEWTDDFGEHYEVRARGLGGRIFSQVVTRQGDGWPLEREAAYATVRAAALASQEPTR